MSVFFCVYIIYYLCVLNNGHNAFSLDRQFLLLLLRTLKYTINKLIWTINWYFQSLEDLSKAVIPDSVYLQKTPNLKSSVVIGML